ncbi:MAG: PEP-CTERM sorting domain-containing protein [Steroidobacteraceae bacterium]|jgi:hypothetical protein
MKYRHLLTTSILALSAWLLPSAAVRADTVLYDSAGFVQGSQSFVQSFNITTAGTITMTLTDIPWLDAVSDLTGFLTTTSGVVGQAFSGSETMSVGPGTIYAHWFGDAQGTYDLGVVGVNISFQPSVITAVPLPASLCLLLSGVGILLGWQRRERVCAEGIA